MNVSLRRMVNSAGERPLRAIEIVIGCLISLDGLYLLSPWYYAQPTSPLVDFMSDAILIKAIGLVYFIGGALAAALSYDRGNDASYRKLSAMFLFCIFTFATVFRLLTFGIYPSGWLFHFLLMMVFAIDWLHLSKTEWKR